MNLSILKAIQYVSFAVLIASWITYAVVDHNPSNWGILMGISIGVGITYGITEGFHYRRTNA